MIIAFTGHRPDKLGGWDPLHPVVKRVKRAIRDYLARTWPAEVISGFALGVDQWAAQIAVDFGIPLTAALPCDDMSATWPLPSQQRFEALLAKANKRVVVSPGPFKNWKLQRRNEWMVDRCERLAAVHDGTAGGTYNCIAYANQVGREVDFLPWQVTYNS